LKIENDDHFNTPISRFYHAKLRKQKEIRKGQHKKVHLDLPFEFQQESSDT
jgi:hypothetical protein